MTREEFGAEIILHFLVFWAVPVYCWHKGRRC